MGSTAADKKKAIGRTPAHAPTLAEIQHQFQEAIIEGGDALLGFIPDSSKTTRDVLFGVYRYAYAARLVEAAGSDYPRLRSYLGGAEFDKLLRSYLSVCPSRHANVRWFGQQLPEYLTSAAPYADQPVLAELAAIERALNDAFDAADAPVVGLEALTRFAPERWGDLCFSPQPSAARLDLATNALAIWRALKDEQEPPVCDLLVERERVIVWRNGVMPMVRSLSAEEAMMWDEAAKGLRFSALCELAATFADAEGAALRAAQYLQGWIGGGMLCKARLMRARRRSSLASAALKS